MMTEYGFYFDSTRCTGCRTCEMACKDYKDTSVDFNYRKVYDLEGGSCSLDADGLVQNSAYCYHVSLSCNHCEDPACAKVCPTTAMHKDEETGLVLVDDTKCIGCGYCHMACPYNAPKVNREAGYSVKCDGCKDRVADGLDPMCVTACPLRALEFGDFAELESRYPDARVGNIAPLPEKGLTNPHLLIKECRDAQPTGDMTVKVSNTLEVM